VSASAGGVATDDSTETLPISLITTVLNEEKSLPAFLHSISQQSCRPSEMIVVDGGSQDSTMELLEEWARRTEIKLTLLSRPGANISEGRNIAITACSYDLIAATDAGTRLHTRWLEELFNHIRPGVDVVAGFFEPTGDAFLERSIAYAITPLLDEIGVESFLPSSRSIMFTKSAWEGVGGYPEWLDYCEDLVFDLALKQRGHTFEFAGEAIAAWSARSNLRSFAKQYFRYARGDGKAGLWRNRHLARYGAYVSATIMIPTALKRPKLGGLLLLGFAAYSRKYVKRVWVRRAGFHTRGEQIQAVALAPVIVVVGDVAKMAGYPAGLRWRRRNRGSA
jgi:glycosyltransferase involved in cell wall biosynthesis